MVAQWLLCIEAAACDSGEQLIVQTSMCKKHPCSFFDISIQKKVTGTSAYRAYMIFIDVSIRRSKMCDVVELHAFGRRIRTQQGKSIK